MNSDPEPLVENVLNLGERIMDILLYHWRCLPSFWFRHHRRRRRIPFIRARLA
jgi:hypothetical protein